MIIESHVVVGFNIPAIEIIPAGSLMLAANPVNSELYGEYIA